MHTLSKPARSRVRAVAVAVMISVGVAVSLGVAHAAPGHLKPKAADQEPSRNDAQDGI